MDKNLFISKLNKAVPGAVLESRLFGRSDVPSIWVEAQAIERVANELRNDPELRLDWLENLSVVELEDVLVVTYFVRSTGHPYFVVLRVSAVPSSSTAWVELPSIRGVWPMGDAAELEAEEMFGIRFARRKDELIVNRVNTLPEGWVGFPMRKKYVFPAEFLGITHSRPFKEAEGQKKIQE